MRADMAQISVLGLAGEGLRQSGCSKVPVPPWRPCMSL